MKDQIEIPKPTIEGFREFLTSKPENEVVGYTALAGYCPFLTYLKTLSGCFITVIGSYYRYSNPDAGINSEVRAEAWITSFVRAIDRLDRFGNKPVTAKQALEVLNKVVAEIS